MYLHFRHTKLTSATAIPCPVASKDTSDGIKESCGKRRRSVRLQDYSPSNNRFNLLDIKIRDRDNFILTQTSHTDIRSSLDPFVVVHSLPVGVHR